MKRLEEVDRLSGQGHLSGKNVAPFLVGYEISVKQTVFEEAGCVVARGAFDIRATLEIPGGNMQAMLALYSQDGDAELALDDGRNARISVTQPGSLDGRTSYISCQVQHLDGYS